MSIIHIENDGSRIVSTTYWGSEYDLAGKIFVSVNAGFIRVLVPQTNHALVREVKDAAYAILSRGPWPQMDLPDAVEILWEDGSDTPFAIQLSPESFDLLPAAPPPGQHWGISLWEYRDGRPAYAWGHMCYWRRVDTLPCLKRWKEE